MAVRIFENWDIFTDLRISTNERIMESPDVRCKEYFEAPLRNVTRKRVRLSLEQARAHVGPDDVVRGREGNVFA